MPSAPDPVKKGANAAASVLESTAGVLRHIGAAGDQQAPSGEAQPAAEPPRGRESGPKARGTKPAAATRQRIANPKAAKKVRAREG